MVDSLPAKVVSDEPTDAEMADPQDEGADSESLSEGEPDVAMEGAAPTAIKPTHEEPKVSLQEATGASIQKESKGEINLEDMFPDDESDDEFQQFTPSSSFEATSGPEAPTSPAYVATEGACRKSLH